MHGRVSKHERRSQGGKSMAGFQSTKGNPGGRGTAEKPYKKGVFTRWRHIAPAGKGGAYQVLLRPATPGRPPLVTFFLYTHLSISISRVLPDEIYCSRGSGRYRKRSQGYPWDLLWGLAAGRVPAPQIGGRYSKRHGAQRRQGII